MQRRCCRETRMRREPNPLRAMNNPAHDPFEQSYRWIKENWNAKNVDVPDELLREWTHSRPQDGAEPFGFHLSVFTFGYLQHEILTHKKLAEVTATTVSMNQILELFDRWQVKLALAAVDRITEIRTGALPLFSFPEDEVVVAYNFPG
jgi:hypothetical protein